MIDHYYVVTGEINPLFYLSYFLSISTFTYLFLEEKKSKQSLLN